MASLQVFLSFLPRAPKFPLPLLTPAAQANYLGVAHIGQWKRLVLMQMCNRHAIRANVNKQVNKRSEANVCYANSMRGRR